MVMLRLLNLEFIYQISYMFRSFFILIIVCINLFSCSVMHESYVLKIKDKTFIASLAKSKQEQRRGLQGISHLQDNEGMFFIYDKSDFLNYWMKDMLISIDIIFINQHHEIVKIYKNIPPCKSVASSCLNYPSKELAQYVLEIKGGVSEKYGFEVGDMVEFNQSSF